MTLLEKDRLDLIERGFKYYGNVGADAYIPFKDIEAVLKLSFYENDYKTAHRTEFKCLTCDKVLGFIQECDCYSVKHTNHKFDEDYLNAVDLGDTMAAINYYSKCLNCGLNREGCIKKRNCEVIELIEGETITPVKNKDNTEIYDFIENAVNKNGLHIESVDFMPNLTNLSKLKQHDVVIIQIKAIVTKPINFITY